VTFIEARGVRAAYGERAALEGVDLAIARGERLALIGPNGSGKTTLVRALAGILRPAGGRILFDGQDLARLSQRERARRIAVVAQTFATPLAFTAREIVSLGRTPHVALLGRLRAVDRDAIDRALEDVDALALADRAFAELSGGERQRVILAMALAQQPEVLLLDEPTTHLDLAHELRTLALVRELALARGLTVLAVLHDVALAASHFDRLVVLDKGRMVADGPGTEIVTPPLLARVFSVAARVYWHDGVAVIVPTVSASLSDRSAS
jgi:iron complex transport system ATP-binding protein